MHTKLVINHPVLSETFLWFCHVIFSLFFRKDFGNLFPIDIRSITDNPEILMKKNIEEKIYPHDQIKKKYFILCNHLYSSIHIHLKVTHSLKLYLQNHIIWLFGLILPYFTKLLAKLTPHSHPVITDLYFYGVQTNIIHIIAYALYIYYPF